MIKPYFEIVRFPEDLDIALLACIALYRILLLFDRVPLGEADNVGPVLSNAYVSVWTVPTLVALSILKIDIQENLTLYMKEDNKTL